MEIFVFIPNDCLILGTYLNLDLFNMYVYIILMRFIKREKQQNQKLSNRITYAVYKEREKQEKSKIE